jgi:hypothetical protein
MRRRFDEMPHRAQELAQHGTQINALQVGPHVRSAGQPILIGLPEVIGPSFVCDTFAYIWVNHGCFSLCKMRCVLRSWRFDGALDVTN